MKRVWKSGNIHKWVKLINEARRAVRWQEHTALTTINNWKEKLQKKLKPQGRFGHHLCSVYNAKLRIFRSCGQRLPFNQATSCPGSLNCINVMPCVIHHKFSLHWLTLRTWFNFVVASPFCLPKCFFPFIARISLQARCEYFHPITMLKSWIGEMQAFRFAITGKEP